MAWAQLFSNIFINIKYIHAFFDKKPLCTNILKKKFSCSQPLASTIEEYFLQEFQLWTEELITPTELRTLTYDYTCQLTALYGAQKADPNIFDKENFVIHVVGARQAEIIDVTRWELFMLELPKLKTLTVVFIGPELK